MTTNFNSNLDINSKSVVELKPSEIREIDGGHPILIMIIAIELLVLWDQTH